MLPLTLQYVRFRTSLWLWARLIPFLAWRVDLPTVLARVAPGRRMPYRGLPARLIAYRAKRAVRRPRVMADRPCLREGLLANRFLRLAGYQPEIHFGVERSSLGKQVLQAHCWIVLGGQTILNEPRKEMILVMLVDQHSRILAPRPAPQAAVH